VAPGSSVVVLGCGGVGLSVVQGARLAGAARIIAVDLLEEKLALARRLGATHTIRAGDDVVTRVRELTRGQGADYSFEAVGRSQLMIQAYAAARRGGTVTIVGLGPAAESLPLNALLLAGEAKTVKGSLYGSATPHTDFPMLLELYRRGRLDLDAMVTRTYRIEEAPQAFTDLRRGLNARGVIVFD
jgi:S-(hydroxymethyl)glutathione dehydrogenase/alcohol dehydrogenase